MRIKIDGIIKDMDGVALVKTPEEKDKDGKVTRKRVDLSVQEACITALMTWQPNDKVPGDEKFKRYELAMLVKGAKKELELPAEDVALIKKQVGDIFSPLVVGQVWNALEKTDA